MKKLSDLYWLKNDNSFRNLKKGETYVFCAKCESIDVGSVYCFCGWINTPIDTIKDIPKKRYYKWTATPVWTTYHSLKELLKMES
tara:strand:- start:506 stop:760 length:255 start_codon:yes stop_codon:yes gene_type:complete